MSHPSQDSGGRVGSPSAARWAGMDRPFRAQDRPERERSGYGRERPEQVAPATRGAPLGVLGVLAVHSQDGRRGIWGLLAP